VETGMAGMGGNEVPKKKDAEDIAATRMMGSMS
jgi:hypothetical protein